MTGSPLAFLAGAICALVHAQAAPETVIHGFGNFPYGASPYAALTRDAAGNFYGTAKAGGSANLGVVFEFDSSGSYKVLHSFQGGNDGAKPYAPVTTGPTGDLFGTTYKGGSANAGVVYKLDASGKETVLYSFTGGADGANPYAGVIADSAGNLYGTTYQGGAANAGVVYKISPSGQESVLYSFTGGGDGGLPHAGLILDAAGNLYGTTLSGGAANCENLGCGVVYKIDPSGHETVLYAFTGRKDGANPAAGVIADPVGNLYGTTQYGGVTRCTRGCGVVYMLSPSGQETVLYTFTLGEGGSNPTAGVVRDGTANLFGTTDYEGAHGVGTVYKLDSANEFQVMYAFPTGAHENPSLPNTGLVLDTAGNLYGATSSGDLAPEGLIYELQQSGNMTTLSTFPPADGGTNPYAGVTRDAAGNLYGTTAYGGANNAGTVFEIDSAGKETVLYSFTGGADGGYPQGGVVLDSAGNLYGSTYGGGGGGLGSDSCVYGGCGVVFKLDTAGQETVLYSFTGGMDGELPQFGVILDAEGNLYGTAAVIDVGGVVYKVTPSGQETALCYLTGEYGSVPASGLIADAAGNLYGTTVFGGPSNAGVIYKVDPQGNETVLYSFPSTNEGRSGPDGLYPSGGLVLDPAGNLYGTTSRGGAHDDGAVYRLNPAGQLAVLYSFKGETDGGWPGGSPALDTAGNLYGTTEYGGGHLDRCPAVKLEPGGCGVVFLIDPAGQEQVLHGFTGLDGADPLGGVILDPAGNVYGTTYWGGAADAGVVFRVGLQ